jgi:hypothetical protein
VPQHNTTQHNTTQHNKRKKNMGAKQQASTPRHEFFAERPVPQGVLIPETPIFVQANCAQKGSWVLGEQALGSAPIDCFFVGFSFVEEFDQYKDDLVSWAVLHFIPVDCDFLRPNLVYTTKIKNMGSGRKGSLSNLGNQFGEVLASGLDPREVLWTMRFWAKSGSLPTGVAYSCAVLDFSYRSVDPSLLAPAVEVIQQERKLAALYCGVVAPASQVAGHLAGVPDN